MNCYRGWAAAGIGALLPIAWLIGCTAPPIGKAGQQPASADLPASGVASATAVGATVAGSSTPSASDAAAALGNSAPTATSATAPSGGSAAVPTVDADAAVPHLAAAPLQARSLVDSIGLTPVITVGERFGPFVWAPLPDGIGAYSLGDRLVLHVNHEIDGQEQLPGFRAAMVSRLELRLPELAVLRLGYPVDGSESYQRLCSASWAEAEAGFKAPGVFLTGEEGSDGRALAVDVQGAVHRLPRLGRFAHENAVPLRGLSGQIGVVGLDDARGKSELYLTLAASSDALLAGQGTLHVFASDAAADVAGMSPGQTISGRFLAVPDPVADGSGAGLQDWVARQRTSAADDEARVFPFVRLEDGDVDRRPDAGPRLYFADTGTDEATGTSATCGPTGDQPCDAFGSLYRLDVDPITPTEGVRLTLLARSAGHGSGWASPDNLATDRNSLMVQEDPAYEGFDRPARIYRFPLDGDGLGAAEAVVEMVEDADGCGPGADCWESSGILSLEPWLGAGSWIFDVQAHGREDIPGIAEGGQLILMRGR